MWGGMEVPLLISLFESFSVWLQNKQKKTHTHTHRICVLSTRRVKIIDHFNIGFSILGPFFAFCPHGE
jgi:hypothetical protein